MPRIRILASLVVMLAPFASGQATRERTQVPDKYKWNLADIFPTDAAWRAAKEKLLAEIPTLVPHHNTLGRSPGDLLAALELVNRLTRDTNRTYVYASLMADHDTRVAEYQAMKQEMQQVATQLTSETAFVEPEILKLDRATVDRFLAAEPKLAVYRMTLDDVLRRQAHTGSEGEERIIAEAGLVT